ncbi:MAG: fused MFS/spermidine synthase [Chthonomonadaceae bacterium]|nr:fused MFS/spermidine synthase [Chthonomonadaceae bacterium]
MRALYTSTIFLNAGLLFLVQPMIAKLLLPRFGGSPAVWVVSMLFFQAVLLLGYAYAHLGARWLTPRWQAIAHLAVLGLAALTLPLGVPDWLPQGGAEPTWLLLGLLAVVVGPSFFALSAGAPLLQRWFAATGDPEGHDPYFLYAASNLGSMIALVGYPLLVEPRLRLDAQRVDWSWGFALLGIGLVAAATGIRKPLPLEGSDLERAPVGPSRADRLRWTALAAVPSSLMLGVTTYLTTNLAPVPLLWVVPLALYLITFILAFARRTLAGPSVLARVLPLLATPLALVMVLEATEPIRELGALHLATFFVAAWMCHARLASERPHPSHLTEFYLWIAVGGVLGGAFNALVAPVVFKTLAEYPVALVAACLLRPRGDRPPGPLKLDVGYAAAIGLFAAATALYWRSAGYEANAWRSAVTIGVPAILCFLAVDRPLRFGLALGALFLAAQIVDTAAPGQVLVKARSFFGVHRVLETTNQHGVFHHLVHGNTTHGIQSLREPGTPLTYYSRQGPIGQVFATFSGPNTKDRVALVGMGVGSLAAYGVPGQRMTYFEIDPEVDRIAKDPALFTFLRDSRAKVDVVLGDARLSLAREPNGAYGLIVLDAFTSDAIPVHLLTLEAIRMYLAKLEPNGVLAFHISNRYLDLRPVLAAAAADLDLVALFNFDLYIGEDEQSNGIEPSKWVVMARSPADLLSLPSSGGWEDLAPTGMEAWSDDFSNLLEVFAPTKGDR